MNAFHPLPYQSKIREKFISFFGIGLSFTQVAWWASYTGPAWEVTQFELVRSYLPEAGQARPRYESLDSWSLGRDAQRAEKRVSPG